MADVNDNQESKEDADQKKKNPLEGKSREELIQLVKKYLNLLKKSKDKSDELNNKYSVLEKEKNSIVQKYETSVKELQDEIESLKHKISYPKEEKNIFAEKDQEVESLKQQLREIIEERNKQVPSIRENEDLVQCLRNQLQTLKASCQCIQEENLKLQEFKKEKLEEISSVNDQNRKLSLELERKVEEYDLLMNVKDNFEKKCEQSVEKIYTLQANIEKLKLEAENSERDKEIIFSDVQKYQNENKNLKEQLQKLSKKFDQKSQNEDRLDIEKIPELKNETINTSSEQEKLLLQTELAQCRLKILELEKEINRKVSPYLHDNCNMGIELALLHGATAEGLDYPVEPSYSEVEINKIRYEDNMPPSEDVCGISGNINKTIQNTNYPFEGNAGLEFALLEGGDLSNLLANNRLPEDGCSVHAPCNDISEYAPELKCEDSVSYYKALLEKYEIEKKDIQIKLEEFSSLYQDTFEENILLKEELENVKAQIAETINISKTATESKCLECSTKNELTSEDVESNAKGFLIDSERSCEKCQNFSKEIANFHENIQTKGNFDLELEISNNPLILLKNLQKLFIKIISDLDRKNFELNDYNSQLELLIIGLKQGVRQKTAASSYQVEKDFKENINTLQLFLNDLISRSSCVDSKLKILESQSKTEIQTLKDQVNQLNELKQFLEEENSALSSEVEKLKCYLSDVENSGTRYFENTYKVKTELYSIDEFDEREIVDSDIKADEVSSSVSDMSVQAIPTADDFAIQTELSLCNYSTDMCTQVIPSILDSAVQTEIDNCLELKDIHVQVVPDVQDFNAQTKLDFSIETKDTFVQITPLVQDSAIQTKSDLYSQLKDVEVQVMASVQDFSDQINYEAFSKVIESKNTQTDCFEETNIKHIDQLINENETLKKVVNEKSTLVDNIHCQMDSLLTKVEELNEELQNKEDDLKNSQFLNADLKRMLIEAENIKSQQINTIKIAQTLIEDLRKKNSDLNGEVEIFNSSYKELITSVNTSIFNIIQINSESIDNLKNLCDHKECNLNIIKMWINDFTCEIVDWFTFINQITPEFFPDISQLEKSIKDSPIDISFVKEICDEGNCCAIKEYINDLNSHKCKLFSSFCNHLHKNYSSIVKSLHDYKEDIIPSLEKNLSELEAKIAECTCKSNLKLQVEADDLSSEKTSEITLKNMLADTETKMNKFKQIAVKLKKELNSTKEQYSEAISEKEKLLKQNSNLSEELNSISEEQHKYVQNYQSLQKEFDKLQDECEMLKSNMKKLENDLSSKLHELNSTKEQVLDLESQLKSSRLSLESSLSIKKDLDIKCTDLESKIIVLESKVIEKEQKINSLEIDITKYSKDLKITSEENKNLRDQLISAQKEGNKNKFLDLEIADYEKSIVELNCKVKRKEDEIEELQKEIHSLKEKNDCLLEELRSTETLKETEAKRAESLKEILEKTKSELNEAKEHKAELASKTASLEIQLERMIQQEEIVKLQLSEASAQIQHLQDVIKTSSDNHQRLTRSFEQKISNQKEEILIAHKEVESVKQEYENYKIRVHSVLKQQKSVTPAITAVDVDLKEKLETINEKLKLQVKDLSDKLSALSLEYDTLQEEHTNLLRRYDKVIEDREQKDKEWHQRLELLNAEKNRLRSTQEELSSQHLLQNEMLVATYKKQIRIMSEEHKKLVNDLQKQLDAAVVEIARLQRDQQKLQGLPVTPSPQDSTTSFDLLSQERQEGEGSENTDETNTPIKHLSLTTIPTTGFLPFEKLIQSPAEPGTPTSYVSGYESEKLATELNTANRKIHHLNELLNDSESTNMRLTEQVRVLKDEVRRLENNKERGQHAENLEYLKNVLVKFATLQPGSEKAMLIPVLTTMLKLSPNEQQQLKSVAGDVQSDDNMNAGWGSYLHRWSGLS